MLFPNLGKSTIYWMISKLVKEGYQKRIRNGAYSLNELKGKIVVYLSDKSKKIGDFLEEEGIENYFSRIDVIIYFTDNFDYSDNHVALIEKAFIDLFYAITRNQYPMSLQELGRTYSNMVRLGVIDLGKMVTMSYKRSLQYGIRHIVESKYVSDRAKKIIKYIE